MAIDLTEEQQRIVDHDLGPALVFAVAGAGKSTAATHRVARLVRERVFTPEQILVSTFNRSAASDLRRKLRAWPYTSRVEVATLHAVGYRILRRAQRLGHFHDLMLSDAEGTDLAGVLYHRALGRAREEGLPLPASVDREDFLAYVSRAKGNLQYADLDGAKLPPLGLQTATQAQNPAPGSVYLDLYRLFEVERVRAGMVTFDDMLLLGWEALVRFPDLLGEVQGDYACVLVDEFQDVNLAQSEMLDLITAEHRNFMAIGDDDQTIYEWRGASVRFILDFEARYGARTYLMEDNFRSPAPHLVLANRVIRHNRARRPKQLQATLGFGGNVVLHRHADAEEQARAVVNEIQAHLHGGRRRTEVAMLLRMYAQTPFIEHFLIEARIPYVIRGNLPFYERPELLVLLAYLRLGVAEAALRAGERVPDAALEDLKRSWNLAANRPTRYLRRELLDAVFSAVIGQGLSFSQALRLQAAEVRGETRSRLITLAEVVSWLAEVVHDHLAQEVLVELEVRIDYRTFLRVSTGMPETAEARANNVLALIEFARGKGSAAQLLAHLEYVSFQRLGRGGEDDGDDVVVLSTIHRAKGAEWPVVFVPDCNAGVYPMGGPEQMEAERRLFYVALTRARVTLNLHAVKSVPLSPFLLEAQVEETLGETTRLASALAAPAAGWSPREALAVLGLPRQLGIERYFTAWWPAQVPVEEARSVAGAALSLYAALEDEKRLTAYRLGAEDAELWGLFGATADLTRFSDFTDLDLITRSMLTTEPHRETARLEFGERVLHPDLGSGTLITCERVGAETIVTVQFDSGGRKRLLGRTAGLLRM